jgi:hypothetical protein
MVFLTDVITQQVDEPAGEVDELRPLFREQRILDPFDQRTLLIVLEKHLLHRSFGYSQDAPQLWKESALFFALMVIVGKRAEKPQEAFDVIVLESLMFFDTLCHLSENIEST